MAGWGQRVARLIYSLIWLLIIPGTFVHFIVQIIRRKSGYSFARLSRYGLEFSANIQRNGLLIHCASVGEVVAIHNLVERLLIAHPTLPITITTNTTTGADRVKLLFAEQVSHAYLPYDFGLFMWLFLQRRAPKKVLINEMELWPNLVHSCHKANIPVYVINGRMSDKSVKTYQKFPALFSPMFNKMTAICAQGKRDQENYLRLGVDPKKLTLTNNIKFDLTLSEQDLALSEKLKSEFNLTNRLILVAGSTHEPEEQVLIDAFVQLKKKYPNMLLVLVPRHPQRFDKVYQLILKQGLSVALMSKKQVCQDNTQVLLCDHMGKLRALYALADVCFVGGSIAKRGGHNALEPAAAGVPVMMGDSIYNNPAICQALANNGALVTVTDAVQMVTACQHWLDDPGQKQAAADAGKQVIVDNSGAIEKTLKVLSL